MMDLPKLADLDVYEKKVIVRGDLDVGQKLQNFKTPRLQTIIPTLNYLLEKRAKIVLVGHRGRPEGNFSSSLSLRIVSEQLSKLLSKEVKFIDQVVGEKVTEGLKNFKTKELVMLENLRFEKGEEENNEEFAIKLASYAEVYVNECFSTSHREHASFVGIPKYLPHAAGFRFIEEVGILSKVSENPRRPVVIIISGIKKDKLKYVDGFLKFADKILIGGRLPEYLPDDLNHKKILIARLMPDKEDITINSIEKFEKEIKKAGTIVLSGPIGKFEEEGHKQGTEMVFRTIAASKAYKIAGGGETGKAIKVLAIEDKFDWISVGGGAMSEFLSKGTLPGIQALLN